MILPTVYADPQLIRQGHPLIDVRAPVEFAKGALPGAVNLPLMDDEERRRVGIAYKEQGQQAAIALGNELVSGAVKEARMAAWRDYLTPPPRSRDLLLPRGIALANCPAVACRVRCGQTTYRGGLESAAPTPARSYRRGGSTATAGGGRFDGLR